MRLTATGGPTAKNQQTGTLIAGRATCVTSMAQGGKVSLHYPGPLRKASAKAPALVSYPMPRPGTSGAAHRSTQATNSPNRVCPGGRWGVTIAFTGHYAQPKTVTTLTTADGYHRPTATTSTGRYLRDARRKSDGVKIRNHSCGGRCQGDDRWLPLCVPLHGHHRKD